MTIENINKGYDLLMGDIVKLFPGESKYIVFYDGMTFDLTEEHLLHSVPEFGIPLEALETLVKQSGKSLFLERCETATGEPFTIGIVNIQEGEDIYDAETRLVNSPLKEVALPLEEIMDEILFGIYNFPLPSCVDSQIEAEEEGVDPAEYFYSIYGGLFLAAVDLWKYIQQTRLDPDTFFVLFRRIRSFESELQLPSQKSADYTFEQEHFVSVNSNELLALEFVNHMLESTDPEIDGDVDRVSLKKAFRKTLSHIKQKLYSDSQDRK